MMRLMVEAARLELARGTVDMEVVRRLCEVIMLQLLRRVQVGVVRMGQAPEAIRYDAHILRAWSAYFAAPSAAWTVDRLADAAGLSRSAFFERFRAIFGAPPLETLTRIRLDHAKQLLTASQAPLPEIAVAVGYQSESALIRAFRARVRRCTGTMAQGGGLQVIRDSQANLPRARTSAKTGRLRGTVRESRSSVGDAA